MEDSTYIAQPHYIEHWSRAFDVSNFGKREKGICISPEAEAFYFKHNDRKYPWELWSEVIASRVGKYLGLDILMYDPAYLSSGEAQVWGCLSPLMNSLVLGEQLIHGQTILMEVKPDFEIEKGSDHDYDLIDKAYLSRMYVTPDQLEKFLEMLIFDALICNRDRHQENWAFIQKRSNVASPAFRRKSTSSAESRLKRFTETANRINRLMTRRLSPIYDSGSSLGHNLPEERLVKMMTQTDRASLNAYANGSKTTAHMRWQGKTVRHIDLLSGIHSRTPDVFVKVLKRFTSRYNHDAICGIIDTIDDKCMSLSQPISHPFILTDTRKSFIKELLYIRHSILCQLLQDILR